MTHLGDADENANSSSSTHLRLRTPINFKKEHEPDYCENHAETGNSTQSSTKTSEDESTTEDVKSNAAIFQHIAVAKVRHQAQVNYNFLLVNNSVNLTDSSFLTFRN